MSKHVTTGNKVCLTFQLKKVMSNVTRDCCNKCSLPSILVLQKQPFRGVYGKSCSENMQQVYSRTSIPMYWGRGNIALLMFGISDNYFLGYCQMFFFGLKCLFSSIETFCLGKYVLRLSKIDHELWHWLYSSQSSLFLWVDLQWSDDKHREDTNWQIVYTFLMDVEWSAI